MSPARSRRTLRRDAGGQMMMLSAIILLVGFVALAGMVARVNQLGTQTTTESRKAVLAESGAVQHALDDTLSSLAARKTSDIAGNSGSTSSGSYVVNTVSAFFSPADIGRTLKGTNIPSGATVYAVLSPTRVEVDHAHLATGTGTGIVLTLYRTPGFALRNDGTTTTTLDAALHSALEQIQKAEAERGLLAGYQMTCDAAGLGKAVVRLSDGDVKVEVRSSIQVARPTCTGSGTPASAVVSDAWFSIP